MAWTTALGFGERGWGPALLEGAVLTLLVSIAGLAIGAVLGSLVAWSKLSGVRVAAAIVKAGMFVTGVSLAVSVATTW